MTIRPAPLAAGASKRFSAPAIILHWACAGLILFNLYLGLKMSGASGLAKFSIFQLHKSIGFAVLALSVLRLVWRLAGPRPPAHPEGMKPWEKLAASLTHWAFYGLMLGMPLTGWIIVSASPTNIPTLLFKTIPVPHMGFVHDLSMTVRRMLEERLSDAHTVLAWIWIGLILLHVGAALKHQLLDRDGVLSRMIPGIGPRPEP